MAFYIRESVGRRGANRHADVVVIQSLLNRFTIPWNVHLRVDGVCATRTVGSIMRFQRQCGLRIDGRVDPMGPTWAHLADVDLLRIVQLNLRDVMAELEDIALIMFDVGQYPQNIANQTPYRHSVIHFSNWDQKTAT